MKQSANERQAELLVKKELSPAEMQEFFELENKRVFEPQVSKVESLC